VKGQGLGEICIPLSSLRRAVYLGKDGRCVCFPHQGGQGFFWMSAADDEAAAPSAQIVIQAEEST
jgi:hypothetical protein